MSPVPILEVSVESLDGTRIIRARGEIDMSSVDRLRRPILSARAAGLVTVVDLTGVEFMDSSGLHLMLGSSLDADQDGWSLCFRPSRQVMRVLQATGTTGAVRLDGDGQPPIA